MSLSIWTRCGGRSNFGPYAGQAWRVVEAQHVLSTRKLVDSLAEHEALEELIEAHKPRVPPSRTLHYLLTTLFRYPPLRHGSRFRGRLDPGVWYGAEQQRTAFAEAAYYRLLFLAGTTVDLTPVTVELSCFRASLKSRRAVDLVGAPFDAYRASIASKTRYQATQRLGAAMRADGAELCRYPSARDASAGACVGVFTLAAFASDLRPPWQSWMCVATSAQVEVSRKTVFPREKQSFVFPRSQFEVGGELPHPAV